MSRFGDLLAGKTTPAPTPAPAPEPVVEEVVEEESEEGVEEESVELFPYESVSLHDMTKRELEEYGRSIGVELDLRHGKAQLISELENYLLTDDQED